MSSKDFRNISLSDIISKLRVGMSFTTKFDGKSIEALCLDDTNEGKIVMLFPEMLGTFDKKGSNIWRDSSIRKKLNSDDFLSKFDENFINHIVVKEVHTCEYVTHDRFWLLSHEEIRFNENFLKGNRYCKKLKYFDGSNESRCFDEMLCSPHVWWLRSAYSSYYFSRVGCVYRNGNVGDNYVRNDGAVLPVCLIR